LIPSGRFALPGQPTNCLTGNVTCTTTIYRRARKRLHRTKIEYIHHVTTRLSSSSCSSMKDKPSRYSFLTIFSLMWAISQYLAQSINCSCITRQVVQNMLQGCDLRFSDIFFSIPSPCHCHGTLCQALPRRPTMPKEGQALLEEVSLRS
jgi:hypothetical protein